MVEKITAQTFQASLGTKIPSINKGGTNKLEVFSWSNSVMNATLYQKIQRLKEEVKYLEDNKTRFLETIRTLNDTRKIVERSVYLCSEMVLDIADLLIVSRDLPKPETYREAIFKLGEHKIIPAEFAEKFLYIAGLRNYLAHEYIKDTTPTLVDFLEHKIEDVKKYLMLIGKDG